MGRSSNASNSALISGESGPAYLPNFAAVPHHHYSSSPPNHHSLPSPPHHIHHQTQYLSVSQLANAAQFFGDTNGGSNGGNSNNLTPPTRVYSPLSHGSNSSTGSSGLSFSGGGSGGGGQNGNLMETIGNGGSVNNNNNVKFEYEDFPQESDGGPVKITTWKDHVSVFSLEQVGVMCDVLLQENDMSRLIELLSTTAKDFLGRSEKILRAQAHVAYHAALEDPRKFAQVYKILESHTFSPQYHPGLQKLWFNAHYKEAEITRGRPQGAVDKYRIRRKFPLPRTIWDGEETIYCFKEKSRNALRESFRLEKYPNLEEKKKLSKETGLSMTQVGNWFKNKRQREKEKEQGKQAAKRPKNPYNAPVALAAAAAMNPEFLGLMLNGGGGAVPPPSAHHLPPHHPHHHPHHPSLQSQIAPMSREEFGNSLRKALFADESQARLKFKSYIEESGVYASAGVSSTTSSSPSSTTSGGGPTNISPYLGHSSSNNNNGSQSTKHLILNGKSDISHGIIGNSPGQDSLSQIQQLQSTAQQQNPRSVNGLTITAIPSPNECDGPVRQHESVGSCDQDSGNVTGSSPINEDINDGIYMGSRPRSNDSTAGLRCNGGGGSGAELVPYLQSGGHHHPLHHNHHNQHLHHPQHIQHHGHHPMMYHAHHHHHLHQSVASPLPAAYDSGVVNLIHSNAAAAALSHA